MKFSKIFIIVPVFVFLFCFSASSARATENTLIYTANLSGEIKAGSVRYVSRSISLAEKDNARLLIIKLETPGGLLGPTKKITDLIAESQVDIAVFAHRKGGWAYSAGSFILLSADYAFARPDSSIGAAKPQGVSEISPGEEDKAKKAMASWIKRLAEAGNRNPEIAEKMVKENLALSGKEALELNLIDDVAESVEEILEKLNISEYHITAISLTLSEKIFNFLSHPYLASLFLSIGFLGFIFAFRTGDFEAGALPGAIFLTIGLWGMGVLNFSMLGTVLIFGGTLLLGIELFGTPGFGISGIAGIALLGLGIVGFGNEPLLSPRFTDFTTLFAFGILSTIFILIALAGKATAKSIRARPVTGSESVVGKRGKVTEPLTPSGKIKIKGEVWTATSDNEEKIEEGAIVVITEVRGNTLIVRTLR